MLSTCPLRTRRPGHPGTRRTSRKSGLRPPEGQKLAVKQVPSWFKMNQVTSVHRFQFQSAMNQLRAEVALPSPLKQKKLKNLASRAPPSITSDVPPPKKKTNQEEKTVQIKSPISHAKSSFSRPIVSIGPFDMPSGPKVLSASGRTSRWSSCSEPLKTPRCSLSSRLSPIRAMRHSLVEFFFFLGGGGVRRLSFASFRITYVAKSPLGVPVVACFGFLLPFCIKEQLLPATRDKQHIDAWE